MKQIVFLVIFGILFYAPNKVYASECTSFSANGINNWYPFSYRDENGQLKGIMVDGMKEALKRVGLNLDIRPDRPWKRIMSNLENAKIDMVLGAYWNSERAKTFLYSFPMGTDDIRVFVKRGNEFPFKTFEDLVGRTGLHLLGGSLGDEFDDFAKNKLNLREVTTSDRIVKMIEMDRADYGILGYIEGLEFITSMELEDKITALQKPILSNDMHVLISKEAECANRLEDINQAINDLKSDGTLDLITQRHLDMLGK